MTGLIVYYGTAMPDADGARAVVDTDVVLQPYHPLVMQTGFRDAFPDARRFVYVNPTSIDPWRLERRDVKPPLLDVDDDWALPRVDLTAPAGWRAAIDEATWALEPGPEQLHGVFVDDLDRVPSHVASAFLAALREAVGWSPVVFLNRAFDSWSEAKPGAVLIEDVRGAAASDDDPAGVERWIREAVIPAVHDVRRQGSRVHRIEYLDTASLHDHSGRTLHAELFDSAWMTAPRSLDDWPSKLKTKRN